MSHQLQNDRGTHVKTGVFEGKASNTTLKKVIREEKQGMKGT